MTDKDDMKAAMDSALPPPLGTGLSTAAPTQAKRNPIVPLKKADEWDQTFTRIEQKLDGVIVDLDLAEVISNEIATGVAAIEVKLEGGLATQLLMNAQVRSLTRQLVWRDAFIIVLIVIIGIMIGFNTMRLWGWE